MAVFPSARAGEASAVERDGRVAVTWPIDGKQLGWLTLDGRSGTPLIEQLSIRGEGGSEANILEAVDPTAFVVVGERRAPAGRPPSMSEFNTFFDSPAERPFRSYRSRLEAKKVRIIRQGPRVTVAIGDLTAGSFSGEWQITVYPGSPLVHLEAVLTTNELHRAFLYDLGLMGGASANKQRMAWTDTEGALREADLDRGQPDRPLAVRHRAIVLAGPNGSVACFPPPHQYFFPRDLTDNQQTVWYGTKHRELDDRFGFGIRQTERGGGAYVPWFNAPPGTSQRLGMFLLVARGNARDAMEQTLAFTHRDRFAELAGYRTLTSHFHMAMAMAALDRRAKGLTPIVPDSVTMFREMGVNMVHLAEFHGDGHPQDTGPRRLEELKAMFDECRRLSGDGFLMMPGEEANVHLGLPAPGRHPGHWLYLFPRPVAWIMERRPGQPFVEDHPAFGKLYRAGDRADMLRLLEAEDGLAWTAHARIKASTWTPDIFRKEDFFLSDHWLGAAWKAMPADLSDDRLGRRGLDLLDDMANWGSRKYLLGEVDVFKLDHTHELYGHMNVNYVRLGQVPRFEDGWKPVLQALRSGEFFVTTGEVLIPDFTIAGAKSGSAVRLDPGGRLMLQASIRGTFPLSFAEVVSGDGKSVHRERIDLSSEPAFADRRLEIPLNLAGRKWARMEIWDIARNGAFTQPVWLER
ncbi:CehA/McbA family metallohydrolase domain-containing protein [Aquisphaera giovannonii]|uniref:hypothetical protein n=1 Tax=Aquisphaera giovannonii TaxID=406548 RepID=UPI0011E04F02|nr:hypothetical protein [Aquisphaera giovannonii]